jgi:hypothetical protein
MSDEDFSDFLKKLPKLDLPKYKYTTPNDNIFRNFPPIIKNPIFDPDYLNPDKIKRKRKE